MLLLSCAFMIFVLLVLLVLLVLFRVVKSYQKKKCKKFKTVLMTSTILLLKLSQNTTKKAPTKED